MPIQITLPDDLAAQIDGITNDRAEFVAEAVRRVLREERREGTLDEVAQINRVVDELNSEAADVLEFQVVR